MSEPSVAILIPTYARAAWLEEAVYSALTQDYSGKIVVLVGNDCPHQCIGFEDPRVEVMSYAKAFPTLGAKRNAMLAYARTRCDWIAFVDDDDVILPWHVSSHFDAPVSKVRIGSHSIFLNGAKADLAPGGPIVRMMIRGDVPGDFDAALDSGEDQGLWREVQTRARTLDTERRPSYVYQWGNGTYHISGSGRPRDSLAFKLDADRRMREGTEPKGNLVLRPQWRRDYLALTSRLTRR